jgi:hypothetical protein
MSLKIKKYPDLSGPLLHYNGTMVLRFSPKAWLYLMEKDGDLVPISGVTNTLKIVDKSAALIGWATRLFLERAIALLQANRRKDGFVEIDYDELVSILMASKDEHKNVLERAGDTGHDAHAFVESLVKATMAEDELRRLEVLAKFPEDERASNAAVACLAFFADHNVRYLAAEQRVVSREWLVAGTMDGDVLIDSCDRPECPCQAFAPFTNKRVVLDLKTSNQVQVTYFAQANFYWKAKVEEFPKTKFDGVVILRLGKDDAAEFEPWFSFGEETHQRHLQFFKRALDLKRSVEETEQEMRDVREARKEKARQVKAEADKIRCGKADDYKGSRMSKCLPDGTQCEACKKIYRDKHPEADHDTSKGQSTSGEEASSS